MMKLIRRYFEPFLNLKDAFTKSAGRSLTTGEINFAKSVFGDQIDYDRVRIFTRTNKKGSASVIGNMMFISEDEQNPHDLSSTEGMDSISYATAMSVFMHEMVHIWQKQNKTHASFAHHKMKFRELILRQDVYKYDISADHDFHKMGIEQQASLVEDFVMSMIIKHFHQNAIEGMTLKGDRHPKEGVSVSEVLDKNGSVIRAAFKPKAKSAVPS